MIKRDQIALLDLDGTVADYDMALKNKMEPLKAPGEPPYQDRYARLEAGFYNEEKEPPHIEARRKLVTRQPNFWIDLAPIKAGFDIVHELRNIGFVIHVLTKGPLGNTGAWTEKAEWCRYHIPDALITVTSDKSIVYGRVLVDDFPAYFGKWLEVRPRGLVVCVAQPWNEQFKVGGKSENANIFRYDETNVAELRQRLEYAFNRNAGES